MSPLQSALATLSDSRKYELARILSQFVNPEQDAQVMTLALDTAQGVAKPFEVGSFTSLYVQDATDGNVSVNIKLNSNLVGTSSFQLKRKDTFDNNGYPVSRAYLDWSAQSGKTITIILFRHASFKPGTTLTQVSGGSTLSDGSSYARAIVAPVQGAAATALFPADSTAIKRTSFNDSGVDLYVGEAATITDGVAVAANKGLLWPNGTPLVSQNTAALYVYNPAGNPLPALIVLTEK